MATPRKSKSHNMEQRTPKKPDVDLSGSSEGNSATPMATPSSHNMEQRTPKKPDVDLSGSSEGNSATPMATPSKKPDNVDLVGYYHPINSPTNSSDKCVFTVQGKRKSHRVLCFVPEKVMNLEDNTPIKLIGCKPSNKSDDLFMSKTTVLENTQLDYDCLDMNAITLNMLPQLAVGGLVTVVGEVKVVQASRTVKNNLTVQDLSVCDKTSSVKMTLWNDLCNSCKKGETYKFCNVRVSVDKLYGNLYLSSTKEDGTTIEEAEHLVGSVESTLALNSNNAVRGEFVAVEKISTYRKCILCNKKVGDTSTCTKKSMTCINCDKPVKIKACLQSFVVKARLQDAQSSRLIPCTLFTDQLVSLLQQPEAEVKRLSMKELEDAIMDIDEVNVTLTNDNIVVNITH
jgi:hypothetical protein